MGKIRHRALNPADAYRRAEKEREKKKNQLRRQYREDVLVQRSPEDLAREAALLKAKHELDPAESTARRLHAVEAAINRLSSKGRPSLGAHLLEEGSDPPFEARLGELPSRIPSDGAQGLDRVSPLGGKPTTTGPTSSSDSTSDESDTSTDSDASDSDSHDSKSPGSAPQARLCPPSKGPPTGTGSIARDPRKEVLRRIEKLTAEKLKRQPPRTSYDVVPDAWKVKRSRWEHSRPSFPPHKGSQEPLRLAGNTQRTAEMPRDDDVLEPEVAARLQALKKQSSPTLQSSNSQSSVTGPLNGLTPPLPFPVTPMAVTGPMHGFTAPSIRPFLPGVLPRGPSGSPAAPMPLFVLAYPPGMFRPPPVGASVLYPSPPAVSGPSDSTASRPIATRSETDVLSVAPTIQKETNLSSPQDPSLDTLPPAPKTSLSQGRDLSLPINTPTVASSLPDAIENTTAAETETLSSGPGISTVSEQTPSLFPLCPPLRTPQADNSARPPPSALPPTGFPYLPFLPPPLPFPGPMMLPAAPGQPPAIFPYMLGGFPTPPGVPFQTPIAPNGGPASILPDAQEQQKNQNSMLFCPGQSQTPPCPTPSVDAQPGENLSTTTTTTTRAPEEPTHGGTVQHSTTKDPTTRFFVPTRLRLQKAPTPGTATPVVTSIERRSLSFTNNAATKKKRTEYSLLRNPGLVPNTPSPSNNYVKPDNAASRNLEEAFKNFMDEISEAAS